MKVNNLGQYRIIFPNSDSLLQEKYNEHLKCSSWTVPYPVSKTLGNQAHNVQKARSFKEDLRKKNYFAPDKVKSSGGTNQSPYSIGIRRIATPASQKQKKRANVSNTNKM